MNKNHRIPLPQKCLAHRGLALCLVAALPGVSLAVEYSASPSVILEERYNDNIRMSRTLSESVTGTILTPRLNLAARTPTWQVGTDMHVRAARYRGIEGLDANSRTVNLFSQVQSERNTLQFGGGRARDSILTDEIPDADTGLVKTQTFRITDSGNTSWTWLLTEKDQFRLGYEYANIDYEDNVAGLYGYTRRGPNTIFTHRLSERTQTFLQASSSLFTIPELRQTQRGQRVFAIPLGGGILYPETRTLSMQSTTNSLQAGIDYLFSKTLKGSLSAGKRKTSNEDTIESCTNSPPPMVILPVPIPVATCLDTTTIVETKKSHGSVYTASLEKSFAASKLSARAERTIDPSGSGTLVQRDTLNLNMNWPKTERLTYLFSARSDKIRVVEGAAVSVDRNQYFIGPSLQWRITQDSSVGLAYRYTYLRYLSEVNTAHANTVSLTFTQSWRKKSISR